MKKFFLLMLILSFTAMAGCQTATAPNESTPSDESDPQQSEKIVMDKNSIVVLGQKPGDSILVSHVQLEKPGFILIEGTVNGLLDQVAKSELLPEGVSSNITIPLGKNTEDGESYSLFLYLDDGDQKLDRSKDTLARDSYDDIVRTVLKIDQNAGDPRDVAL